MIPRTSRFHNSNLLIFGKFLFFFVTSERQKPQKQYYYYLLTYLPLRPTNKQTRRKRGMSYMRMQGSGISTTSFTRRGGDTRGGSARGRRRLRGGGGRGTTTSTIVGGGGGGGVGVGGNTIDYKDLYLRERDVHSQLKRKHNEQSTLVKKLYTRYVHVSS